MKKILFALCVLLFVVLLIPRHGAAEAPSSTPVPDALVAEALAAKQASYPAWVGDEVRVVPGYEISRDDFEMAPETPQEMGDWVMTALQLFKDNSWELYGFYSYNFGTSQIRLTNHPASDILPNLNRGATQIAFASNRDGNYEIYKMDTSGNSLVRLTSNNTIDSQPSWSFDNSQIIFVSDRDGNAEIYKMSADGLNQVRLTTDPATDISPTWSPDGTQIGFLKVSGYSASVWIMNSDGSNPHAISSYYPYAGHLRWSPDGNWLAFDGDITGDDWNENIIVRPDGTNIQQFFLSSTYLFDRWVSGWTPDSQEILANAVTYVVYEGQLYISGTSPYRVTLSTGDVSSFYGTTYDFDMNLDSESTEIDPPFSNITPLQKYSKINNFSLDWAANDVGLAGLWYVDFEHRIGNLGVWSDLTQSFGTSGSIDYSGNPGETVYFRSQAMDNAENLEAWPSVGWDTFTTFYQWALNGHVFDNREINLSSPTITVSPESINSDVASLDGSFILYNAVTTTTVAVSQPGYEAVSPTKLVGDQDKEYFWALSPSDTQILNGDFETGSLNFWEVDGSMPASWSDNIYHSGNNSGKIGRNFLSEQSTNISNTSNGSGLPQIAKTPDGVLHAIWTDATPIGGNQTPDRDIFYSFKAPDSTWSSPIIVAPIHQYNAVYPELVVGVDGTLHVVWLNTSYGGSNIGYTYKPLGEAWSGGEVIGELPSWSYQSFAPQIDLDSLGGVYVTWSDSYGPHYINKPENGPWSAPLLLGNYGVIPHDIVVDLTDTIFVFYVLDGALREIHKSLDGNWSSEQPVFPNVENFMVEINPLGGLSILWKEQTIIYLADSDANGNWSDPLIVSSQGVPIELRAFEVSDTGEIFICWMALEDNQYNAYFRQRYLDETWSFVVPLTNNFDNQSGVDLLGEPDGSYHLIWGGAYSYDANYQEISEVYYEKILWPQSEQGAISQIISLPSMMNKPTLSFAYLLDVSASNNENSEFEVLINQQSVYSTIEISDWSHVWIDLSPWLSQTITITFQLKGYAYDGFVTTYLDDITVSSWLTPVPTSVDVTNIPLPTDPVQITITGENFIEGATVALNDISLENVQWIDEHTLLATVPANLPPGRYNLWVTNPGGQASVLAGAVIAGQEVFLPIVVH